jgi:hypothetical protein
MRSKRPQSMAAGFQRRRRRSRIASYDWPCSRAARTAGSKNVAVKLRAHAFDDLVIEQLVSLSFAAEDMPLTPPTVLVLGAGSAALAHPPELARRNHFSHPESIAFGFVSPHPTGLLILLAVFSEDVEAPNRFVWAGRHAISHRMVRSSDAQVGPTSPCFCRYCVGLGIASRPRMGERHNHTNENNPPTTPTRIAHSSRTARRRCHPPGSRAFPKPHGPQSDSLERVRVDLAASRLAPRSSD